MKNNKNGKVLNTVLSIIAFISIVLIIFWLISKNNANVNNLNSFNNSLNTMQETAKKYFEDKLPSTIGETNVLTLDEMIDEGISKEIKYGKITCNKQNSYISVTRSNDNEYKVKSNLVCGDIEDNIIEKISIKSVIKDTDGTIKDVDDNNSNNINNDSNNNNNIKNNVTSSCQCTSTTTCTIYEIPTTCTIKYTYEHVKYDITCPEGYVLNGNICQKVSEDTRPANESYSEETTKVVDAIKNDGDFHKVYTDYTITGGETKKYCEKGTMQGNYCYEYTDKVLSSTSYCPSGYTKEGNRCYKYTGLITEEEGTCPYGYIKKGNACYKYAELIEGNPTCPSGYTKSGNTCYKTTNADKTYTNWGNPKRTYSTKNYEKPYEYELEKKVLLGSPDIAGIKTYNYGIYTRTVTGYSCKTGTEKNGLCYTYAKLNEGAKSCPSGYAQSGSTCYIKKDLSYSSSSYCANGYTQSGNICYKETGLIEEIESNCPSGYTKLDNKCYKATPVKTVTSEKVYSCPTGYTKTGNKENTKCYKEVKSADTYYCENENATLNGKLCYIKEESKFLGNYCPYGYTLEGTTCYKTTTETTSPIWSNAKYIYTENKYESGYQFTGRATYVRTCVRDDGRSNPEQDPNTMK